MPDCGIIVCQHELHTTDGYSMNDKWKDRLLGEARSKQSNVVWPDAPKNAVSVDALLWRGSPNATTIQRIGMAVFGLAFLFSGIGFLAMIPNGTAVLAVIGIPFLLLGLRVLRNAFRH